MKKLLSEPIVKFLAGGFLLYISWLALYEWVIHPDGSLDDAVIQNTLSISTAVLERMGYVVERTGERAIQIQGTPGLFIGDSCNGISLFALFSIFIIAFPGKLLSKLVFIPIGILIIHLLNVSRVVLLAIIETYSYEWTEFNHTYTFTLIIYAFIFGMWIVWINRFSNLKKKSAA